MSGSRSPRETGAEFGGGGNQGSAGIVSTGVTEPLVAPAVEPRPPVPATRSGSRRGTLLVVASCLLLTAACSSSKSSSDTGSPAGGRSNPLSAASGPVVPGWDCRADCDWVATDGDRAAIEAAVAQRTPRSVTGASGGSTAAGQGETADAVLIPRLGVVDDNAAFPAFVEHRRAFDASGQQALAIPLDRRQIIKVVDQTGKPVLGATIEVRDAAGLVIARLATYADGRAVFLGAPSAANVLVTKAGAGITVPLAGGPADQLITLDLSSRPAPTGPVKLDVQFVVDTTGSMTGELARLQQRIDAITAQVAQLPGKPEVRFGLTVYRDRGDAYVSRTYALTPDPSAVAQAFAEVTAAGGGDTREDVQSAMRDAITKPGWSQGDAIRILFLLGDAAPHLEYQDASSATLAESAQAAAELGIKIVTIGAQGIDDQGELVFRQLAQATMGRYVYLNGDADGAPGTVAGTASVPYDQLPLDDLIVRLVADEIAAAI